MILSKHIIFCSSSKIWVPGVDLSKTNTIDISAGTICNYYLRLFHISTCSKLSLLF